MKKINIKIKGEELKKKLNIKDGENGKNGSPDSAEEIRNKLESLEGENRLDKSVIKGLEEDIKSLKENINNISPRRGVGAGGPNANAVQFADLTSQCNGSTKTFSVPRHRVALLLVGTQFPLIYRNITDFTTANVTLTLTAEVKAPTTGQSLIFLFVK